MPKLDVPIAKFDLKGLTEDTNAFWGSYSIRFDLDAPPNTDTHSVIAWLKGDKQNAIIVPFSSSCVDSEPIQCADGSVINPDDVAQNDDQDLREATVLAEDAGYGFYIRAANDNFEIDFCVDGELVEVVENAGLFEKPMQNFIERYRQE